MCKQWSHQTHVGTFVIKTSGDRYVLLHYGELGEALLRFDDTPEELLTVLLSNFPDGKKFSDITYNGNPVDTSTLGIPSDLREWQFCVIP
jgi:hypothetical protein